MPIYTRRNAVVGWFVLKLGRRVATKKKTQGAVPVRAGGAAAGAAALGGILVWRKKRSGSTE